MRREHRDPAERARRPWPYGYVALLRVRHLKTFLFSARRSACSAQCPLDPDLRSRVGWSGHSGVTEGHPGLADAMEGTVYPRGGHTDPALHNLGDTESVFTSWSTDKGTAQWFATKYGRPGVLLELRAPVSRLIASPNAFDEAEVLIEGPVLNAAPTWVQPIK